MPFLDWAEKRIDRSIISVGESCKTWFQEVWRLVFRVLVFWLSILLGFLHKPSFEKWIAEQRGRIHPYTTRHRERHVPLQESLPNSSSQARVAHVGSYDPSSALLAQQRLVPSSSPSTSDSRHLRKRKSGRAVRTGFADLLGDADILQHDHHDSDLARQVPRHGGGRATSRSQPASYSEESLLEAVETHSTHSAQSTPRGLQSTSSRIAIPARSNPEDEDDAPILSNAATTTSRTHEDEEEDSSSDRASTASDDYDEFYGHKPSLPSQPRSVSARKPTNKRPLTGHSRTSSLAHVGSPGSSDSGNIHMFSMEGIDSATSPLLQHTEPPSSGMHINVSQRVPNSSGNFDVAPTALGEVHDSLESSASQHSLDSRRKTLVKKGSWSFDIPTLPVSQVEKHATGRESLLDGSLPPLADTLASLKSPSARVSSPYDLQSFSVPAHLDPPLVGQKRDGAHSSRPGHKRSRSMSPVLDGGRYSIASRLGGTGRRSGSGKLGRADEQVWSSQQRYSTIDIHKDRIFASDKLNTGAMEDLRMWILLQIDRATLFVRFSLFGRLFRFLREFSLRKSVFGVVDMLFVWLLSPQSVFKAFAGLMWQLTFGVLVLLFYLPSRFISGMKSSSFDKRTTEAIVSSQGYPYESYEVVTDDGYILRLERLSRPKSTRVIYFQHGVVDNSFAWFGHVEGEAGSALAFRAFDQGFDVFVGTFRGCEGSTRHVRGEGLSSSEYWNFTVNEHGMYDLKAFIEKIVELKKSELGASYEPRIQEQPPHDLPHRQDNKFDIMLIAHSMGAMASLIYLVWSKIKARPHHISCAILLSPAGYHITAPAIVNIMGPIINLALWLFPWIHTLKFPGEAIRILVSKILEDVNNSFTGRTMISWAVAKVIGGSIEDHPFVNLRNLTYNVFSGTSTGVFRHFWQIWVHKRFEGYDYGHAKNMQIYGQLKPIDFIDYYHKYVPQALIATSYSFSPIHTITQPIYLNQNESRLARSTLNHSCETPGFIFLRELHPIPFAIQLLNKRRCYDAIWEPTET